MASIYELTGKRCIEPSSAAIGGNVDIEFLNNKITRTLLDLGLTRDEARVLLFMNKKGEMKASEIAKNVEIPRTHLYYLLENLQSKGLVFSTIERPAKFRALALDRAVDFLLESYRHKLCSLEKAKEVVSHDWFLLQENEVVRNVEYSESVQILSGEAEVHNKVENLLRQAGKEFNIFGNAGNLAKISYEDIMGKLQLLSSNGRVVKILTNPIPSHVSMLEEINKCEIGEIPTHFSDKLCFMIVDNNELLLMNLDKEEISAIWTNSRSFVDSMNMVFTMGWNSASVYATVK